MANEEWGPLAGLIGTWEGDKGMDVSFHNEDGKIGDTPVFEQLRGFCRHSACPVPTAVIKGIEVACGLALAKDATIHVEKDL